MKPRIETSDSKPGRRWLALLGWALAMPAALILLYISSAIIARVLFLKGIIPDRSRTLTFAETVFAPINYPYSYSPTFKAAFDGCVGVFVPKQQAEK